MCRIGINNAPPILHLVSGGQNLFNIQDNGCALRCRRGCEHNHSRTDRRVVEQTHTDSQTDMRLQLHKLWYTENQKKLSAAFLSAHCTWTVSGPWKRSSQKSPVNGGRTSAPIGSNIHAHVKMPRRTLLHPDTEGAKVRSCFIFPLRNKLFSNRKAEHLLTYSYLCICSFSYFAGFVFFHHCFPFSALLCSSIFYILCA